MQYRMDLLNFENTTICFRKMTVLLIILDDYFVSPAHCYWDLEPAKSTELHHYIPPPYTSNEEGQTSSHFRRSGT